MHAKTTKRTTRSIISLIAAAAVLLLSVCGAFTVMAADDYHTWRQDDSRWGSVAMGDSTVARTGCLITDIAIMAMHSGSVDSAACKNLGISSASEFNPGVLAMAYTAADGFTSDGAIASWGTITKLIPSISFSEEYFFSSETASGKASEIKKIMDSGRYVICNVGGHWVFVEGVVGSTVYMIDPAKDDVLMFSAYSNSNITYCDVYTCKNTPPAYPPAATTTTTVTTTTVTTTTVTTTPAPTVTTTTSTVTTTTTTATTTTTTPIVTSTVYITGEYLYSGDGPLCVMTADDGTGDTAAQIPHDSYIKIIEVRNDHFGLVSGGTSKDAVGWIDLEGLTRQKGSAELMPGDIDGDGAITIYDLSLLNEYLKSREQLPDGVCILRGYEASACDINSDGAVDLMDVLDYLSKIYNSGV